MNEVEDRVWSLCNKIYNLLVRKKDVENPTIISGLCRMEARLFLSILYAISVCRDIKQFYKLEDGVRLLNMLEDYVTEMEGKTPVVECH
jgi:hypothetical protein